MTKEELLEQAQNEYNEKLELKHSKGDTISKEELTSIDEELFGLTKIINWIKRN